MRVIVQKDDFDVGIEAKILSQQSVRIGGMCTFVGLVRDLNEDDDITGLYLEHYPGMTEKQIHEIIMEASGRWQVITATVIHRVGQLTPGEQIVYVGVASEHRADAFDACEYIIDYLKTRATFWKKETTTLGDRWLETRQSDIDTAGAWVKKS
ncbi:MAG: molybdopterin synthase catalytic subunit MoaE [Pseudomonadales bacterium]|nr:molybdopterin synthase catalytic subunit MoaE [Pseudomonadales bacterium]